MKTVHDRELDNRGPRNWKIIISGKFKVNFTFRNQDLYHFQYFFLWIAGVELTIKNKKTHFEMVYAGHSKEIICITYNSAGEIYLVIYPNLTTKRFVSNKINPIKNVQKSTCPVGNWFIQTRLLAKFQT